MNPKHSIIIPAYNTGEAICKCIDSVIAQTYPDWELIVVDDGSMDSTPAIIDEYAQKDERIHVIHIPNAGVSNARNVGLDNAKGEYVMFVDSDDWIEPDYLQQIDNHIDDNADMYIVGITQDHEDERGHIYYSEIKGAPVYRHITTDNIPGEIGYLLQTINMESSCLKSYRRSFLTTNNIRFLKGMIIFEDFYFVLQCLLHKSSICLIPFIGYHYRMELNYNPIAHRGGRDLYPSVSNLFVMLDKLDTSLRLQGYSHEQVMRCMTGKIQTIICQSRNATTYKQKIKPFREVAQDKVLNAHISEILMYAGGRYRLQYKFTKKGLYFIAYLICKYL